MLRQSIKQCSQRRQRGISLSRTSSLQKLSQIPLRKQLKSINQSFQCFQPKGDLGLQDQSLIENNQNHMNITNKYASSRPRQSYRNAMKNSHRQNIVDNQQASILWEQAENISQMIQLLIQYQKMCQQKMDLSGAEQARKKINQLKKQQIKTRTKQIEVQGKSYISKTRRQANLQAKQFQTFWQQKISQAYKALQQIQQTHIQQQQKQLLCLQSLLSEQPLPRIKHSSKVLQIRHNLSSLIKSRKYKQAQHLKSILQKKQSEEQQKWIITCEDKRKLKIKEFRKKQIIELEAFRLKLNSSFNQLIKEKQKQQERMDKNIRKKQIQSSKIPSSLLKAKTNLLNQTKAVIDHSDSF